MKTKLVFLSAVMFVFLLLLPSAIMSQEYQCNSCGGEGFQDCIRCEGGSYSCPNCGGAGGRWEICNCNNGVVTMPDATIQTCDYCKGEGRKWHSCFNPLCNGGNVSCNFCGGQGSKPCPTCNGSGKN